MSGICPAIVLNSDAGIILILARLVKLSLSFVQIYRARARVPRVRVREKAFLTFML